MMTPHDPLGEWHVKVIGSRIPWKAYPPRAAEVGQALGAMMLSGEYSLEDAEYQKIVPNEFVVELSEENYQRNYQPIEERLLEQWRARLLEQLATVNSRQGRSLYQLSAPLRLEIRPAADLKPTQVRIHCRVQSPHADSASATEPGRYSIQYDNAAVSCLEMLSGEQRWPLRSETVTIGRDESCDIQLNMPDVQEKRLISGQHAYLRLEGDRYTLHDGSPDGQPSTNGTFLNHRPVSPVGQRLEDGDTIILAALDPKDPRPDVPGVVVLQFLEACD